MKTRVLTIFFLTLALAGIAQQFLPPATAQKSQRDDDDDRKRNSQNEKGVKKDDDDDDDRGQKFSKGTPVLTVKGLCATNSSGKPCETVVTRAQFEKLAMAIAPDVSPQTRNQLATSYPKLMVMSRDAQLRGLDKGPRFEELLRFARMQILAQELVRTMKQQAGKISDQDVVAYYAAHKPAFELATVERVFVPLRREDRPAASASDPAPNANLAELADQLHTRAVAGEDFAKLQAKAYTAAGSKVTAPSAPQSLRRSSVPVSQSSIFDLKPGQVSAVINDNSGHYIYKMVSKDVIPVQNARKEIVTALQSERMHKAMDEIDKSYTVDVNQPYFAATTPKQDEDDD